MSESIVLTGPMGSGKTSVGKLLARKTGHRFVDLDALIVENCGKAINEIFEQDGETLFRQKESELLSSLVGQEKLVVSTGGGAVMSPENRVTMRSIGRVVNLTASLEHLAARLACAHDRPLLKTGKELAETISELLLKREHCYADCDIRIDTTGKSVEDVAAELLRSI